MAIPSRRLKLSELLERPPGADLAEPTPVCLAGYRTRYLVDKEKDSGHHIQGQEARHLVHGSRCESGGRVAHLWKP